MKCSPRACSLKVLWILTHSGFGAKCGAPHIAPLLPNTQYVVDPTRNKDKFANIVPDEREVLISR
jgi:hypothetical protein